MESENVEKRTVREPRPSRPAHEPDLTGVVGEIGIVTDRPTPLRPAGDVGPYLWDSNCIAMAKVGTVVPRCPRIVGEMRTVTDRPTLRPAGDAGP